MKGVNIMNEKSDCSVFMRHIQLTIILPVQYAYKFFKAAGRVFGLISEWDVNDEFRKISIYYSSHGHERVAATIYEDNENKFYQFLYAFCRKNKITFIGTGRPEFEENFLTYNALRSDQKWLDEHKNKWVVFVNGNFVISGDTEEDVLHSAFPRSTRPSRYSFYTQVISLEDEEGAIPEG